MNLPVDRFTYQIEILPPKQESEKLEADLQTFADKYRRAIAKGDRICITDNAMGHLAFQGIELIDYLELPAPPEQVTIHINTFHTKADLHKILDECAALKLQDILIVSGDGSERLPKLRPTDVAAATASVTAVELLSYIDRTYRGVFTLGVAFNPYEPATHEFDKLARKFDAGASFIVTQPIIGANPVIDRLLAEYHCPVVLEAWMSKKLHLLSQCVGYEIPEDTPYDPLENLLTLHRTYPQCGLYLALVGFKTQYDLLDDIRTTVVNASKGKE